MSYSYTFTNTESYTLTHARHMAAKVATDLKRMQRFYGEPPDQRIDDFEVEVIEFLKEGLLDTVAYGFKRNGFWVEPTLFYTARDLMGVAANDDDPGRVRPGADITGASFYSFLTYNSRWNSLTWQERREFAERLPFQRSSGTEPGANGYWSRDLTYSAGGRALDRSSLRSYR